MSKKVNNSKSKTNVKTKSKSKYTFSKTSIIIFLLLTILLTVFAFVFKKPIEEKLNKNNVTQVINYDGLVMHTIDVGQAEAIMIKLPDGKNMLVDSGNKGSEKNEKLKSYLINNYFASVSNKEIDYFVITHSDADHTGGAVMIFDNFQVNKVFRPNLFSDLLESEAEIPTSYEKKYVSSYKENWKAVVEKMYSEPNCEVEFSKAGIEIIESNYSIKFCAPTEDNYSNVNSYSPIIILEYSSRKIMLTGDATTQTESYALANLSHCDILKVAHHGSKTSTSVEFLNVVNPNYAIISANANDHNNYGLPKQEILNRLEEYMPSKNIFRTDLNGNIVLTISSASEINFILDVQNNNYYIKVEYILGGAVVVLFIICFSKGKKKVKK